MKSKPPKTKKKAITVLQARRLAAKHVMARMFGKAPVRDGEKTESGIYFVKTNQVWLVFPDSYRDEPVRLRSSDVVVVCKRTGRILYDGLAGDEG
jgi:hypothetical protein